MFMKKLISISIFLFLGIESFGQMPFATYAPTTPATVNARHIKKYGTSITQANDIIIESLKEQNLEFTATEEGKRRKETNERKIKFLKEDNRKKIKAEVDSTLKALSKADFLDHMNANITTIQNGKKMFPTINGEVINYKLSIWTSYIISTLTDDDGTKKKDTIPRRHYLPISLFTKVSGNYSDSAAGPSDDACSFFGAPLTLRFSPAFELLKNKLRENKLFIGLNTDMRLLTIGDTIKNKLQTTWGVYGSAGISYLGRGFAYDDVEETDEAGRHDGTWSFTAMLYFFKSGGNYSKAIFGNYEKKTLTGVELLLRFKTSKKEDAKFNFLIGASNCFTKGAANTGWQFRLGIGS